MCFSLNAKMCRPQFPTFSKLYEETASVAGVRVHIVGKSPRVKGAFTH